VGTGVACLMFLWIAVRAAGSISGERDRQTLDTLLTSPLGSAEILYGKWLGSILSVRWAWVWLGAIWLIGVLTGGLNVVAVPLTLGAWWVFAAFAAVLGLWYSTVSRGTLRATVWTLLTLVGLWGGHWLLWACCGSCLVAPWSGAGVGNGEALATAFEFQAFTLTPPAALAFLAFLGPEFNPSVGFDANLGLKFLVFSLLGVGLWGGAAAVLFQATITRFSERYGRTPRVRPRTPQRLPAPGVISER
jgi:hypothetical protein